MIHMQRSLPPPPPAPGKVPVKQQQTFGQRPAQRAVIVGEGGLSEPNHEHAELLVCCLPETPFEA